jgi:formamidopyrimidine-DNA glycosylase
MPELPEVTTIVSDLNKYVRGKKIKAIKGDTPKLIQPYSFSEFERLVRGKMFEGFERRGKFIVANLSSSASPYTLVWHMRMTGHLLYRDGKKEDKESKKYFADRRNQYVRFSILFTDRTRLDYSDLRKFGTLHLFTAGEISKCKGIAILGPDALEHQWTAKELRERFEKKKVALKQALLDQTVIAGIGNIYADEILWESRLHPLLKTATLSLSECKRLIVSMKKILRAAVKHRGSSVDDYRDVSGKGGSYSKFHRAYQQEGKPCFRCGEKIVRIKVNGRGTCFCPVCQK